MDERGLRRGSSSPTPNCPEATAARCVDADRTGLDLIAETPSGETEVRVPYDEPIDGPEGLRKATVKLARARAELAEANPLEPRFPFFGCPN